VIGIYLREQSNGSRISEKYEKNTYDSQWFPPGDIQEAWNAGTGSSGRRKKKETRDFHRTIVASIFDFLRRFSVKPLKVLRTSSIFCEKIHRSNKSIGVLCGPIQSRETIVSLMKVPSGCSGRSLNIFWDDSTTAGVSSPHEVFMEQSLKFSLEITETHLD
jgi:hypothetical protein